MNKPDMNNKYKHIINMIGKLNGDFFCISVEQL